MDAELQEMSDRQLRTERMLVQMRLLEVEHERLRRRLYQHQRQAAPALGPWWRRLFRSG